MRILVSNDDGVFAPGIQVLSQALAQIGEVWIVAPDSERSANSHALTLKQPLRLKQLGERQFCLDGTPADCVYFGLHHVLPNKPDIVVSGINYGANLGHDVLYSGTVAAAMEGAIYGFSALAVSLCIPEPAGTQAAKEANFADAASVACDLVKHIIEDPMPKGVTLNANIPFKPRGKIGGIKLCRLGYTDWSSSIIKRHDPRGKPYYWIGGERNPLDNISDSDTNAVAAGYISVTPIHYDITDYRSFAYLRELNLPGMKTIDDDLQEIPPLHPTPLSR
ncbi:MAG: 5'/3'-nucleotidase SurE [Deltaproteobacteria bacterium]|nr:5'/3'-nucleotidase SurE [Deltaproteobacteria bacterium]